MAASFVEQEIDYEEVVNVETDPDQSSSFITASVGSYLFDGMEVPCPEGFYCNSNGLVFPMECQPGSYSTGSSTDCDTCGNNCIWWGSTTDI